MTKVTIYLNDYEEVALQQFASDSERNYEEHNIPVNPALGHMTISDAAALMLRIGLNEHGYLQDLCSFCPFPGNQNK